MNGVWKKSGNFGRKIGEVARRRTMHNEGSAIAQAQAGLWISENKRKTKVEDRAETAAKDMLRF